MDSVTNAPLKAAMQSLRNYRAQAPASSGAVPAGAAAPPPGPSIDRSIDPSTAQPPPPPAGQPPPAATRPKPTSRPKAKPKAHTKPKPKPTPSVALVPEIVEDCENGISVESDMPEINIKDQLTEKEARFIDLWLRGGLNVDRAMEAAGYKGFHQKTLYRIGKKIVEKYETSAGEHRKIMRAMGYGETTALANLIDSATNAKSEIVRLTARTTLAKCLGLFSDAVVVNQGIQIIIKGRGEDSGRPTAQIRQEVSKVPPRTMAITK